MTRGVADAALLLAAMAGSDPADPATGTPDPQPDFGAALGDGATLQGRRLGVIVPPNGSPVGQVYAAALARLAAQGAVLVPVTEYARPAGAGADEDLVLRTEFKADLNAWLASLPPGQPATLAALIAFNAANPRELSVFGQDYFEKAQATAGLDDPGYIAAQARLQAEMRALIDKTLAQYQLDALIQPSEDPAFRIDLVRGNDTPGAFPASPGIPAMAGYPHLTVPMGQVNGLPVGISLIGPAWSDGRLLGLGAAVEKALAARRAPGFLPTLEAGAALEPAR
jgi:amidase